MPEEFYAIAAQAMRWWFLFLMFVIAWRALRWYRKDKRQARRKMKLLPDSGYVGEMVVLYGEDGTETGSVIPVPHEGMLGNRRTCDIFLPGMQVARKQLWFRYEHGEGLYLEPMSRNPVSVDGVPVNGKQACMAHGSILQIGEIRLQLRLFAGFESYVPAAQIPEEQPLEIVEEIPELPPMMQDQQVLMQQNAFMQGYMMAQQQAWQQANLPPQTAVPRQPAPVYSGMQNQPAPEAVYDASMAPSPEEYRYDPDPSRQMQQPVYQTLRDDSVYMRPEGSVKRSRASRNESNVTEFETHRVFYAPVMDDDGGEEDDMPSGKELRP